jgi:ADP-heptose:LPS heptosyltransferase
MGKCLPPEDKQPLLIRIAILSASGLGDIISAGPMLNKLKALYPHSTITLYTQRQGPLASIQLYGINQIVVYRPSNVWRILLGERYDLLCAWGVQAKIFELRNRFFYRLLIRIFPAKQKLVYDRSDLSTLKGKSIVAIKLDLLQKLACQIASSDYKLLLPFPVETGRQKSLSLVSGLTRGLRRLVILHVGAKGGHTSRFWPVEHWVETGRFLLDTYDVAIAFIGTSDEAQETQSVIDRLDKPVFNLVDQLSVIEMAALIEAASLVISTNSGPMWVAAALHKPQIALCGPSRHEWDPLNDRAVVIRRRINRVHCDPPCDRQRCRYGDIRCMIEISADQVVEAIRDLRW